MTTISIAARFLPLAELIVALRRSWLAAGVDAVGSALTAMLLGSGAIDPEVGFRR